MVIQPPWRLPHTFERLSRGVPIAGSMYVMTYGITVPELCRAESLVEPRLLDRIGLPWLADLEDQISRKSTLRPLVAALGITSPDQMSSERLWHVHGASPAPVDSLWTSLGGAASARVLEFINNELVVFGQDLEANAPGGRPSESLRPAVRRFLDVYPVRFRPRRYRDRATGWKETWGTGYERLLERVALELQWLYADRPRLRRCVLCGAIYVTNEKRANCYWTLWNVQTGEEVQRCSPPADFASFTQQESELAHRRARKKLNEAHRRALLAAGGDKNNRRVKAAQRERDAYMRNNGRRRGPTPKLDTSSPGIVHDE